MAEFKLKVATLDGIVFDDMAVKLIVRTVAGDKAILYDHEPYTAPVGNGKIKIVTEGSGKLEGFASGGFVSITENEAIVLADKVELSENNRDGSTF